MREVTKLFSLVVGALLVAAAVQVVVYVGTFAGCYVAWQRLESGSLDTTCHCLGGCECDQTWASVPERQLRRRWLDSCFADGLSRHNYNVERNSHGDLRLTKPEHDADGWTPPEGSAGAIGEAPPE